MCWLGKGLVIVRRCVIRTGWIAVRNVLTVCSDISCLRLLELISVLTCEVVNVNIPERRRVESTIVRMLDLGQRQAVQHEHQLLHEYPVVDVC